MPVKSTHPQYDQYLPKWKRCRDVSQGQDAIYAGATNYLPQLKDQDNVEYQNYLTRAPFYNATWRTIVGLQGMLFRKPPMVVVPSIINPMIKDVTMSGTPLHIFALECVEEVFTTGRVGIFVDYPLVDAANMTQADAQEQQLRPLMKKYLAEAIINWKVLPINNKPTLAMVVLSENKLVPVDEFKDNIIQQYRVLDLYNDSTYGYIYRVRVFEVKQEKDLAEQDVLISSVIPIIDGKPLNYIPFYFSSTDDVESDVDEPPLIDLVDMNLSHFKTTADYEHGCHFTGLPTPVITGHVSENDGEKLYIGSACAWVFAESDAKAFYLEFKGEGLMALENNLKRKETHMAILGARMLEVQSKGVESADTAAIHRTGEQSMLASVSQAVSIAFTKALETFCAFAGAKGDISFKLNKDFFPVPMDSLQLTALIAAWQNSAISYDTLIDNLKSGEILEQDATPEQERALIEANPPPIPSAGTTPGNPHPNAPRTEFSGTGNNPTITQLQHQK
jgi:hypothetical protein